MPIKGFENNGQGMFGNQLSKPCLYNPNVELSSVGSEAFNAPELWDQLNGVATYDGVKADIFSAAATLFMMSLKF